MKKLIVYILLLLFGFGTAQKMAYVDTQSILKQMPQYQQSEQRLNNEVKKWQDEIVSQQSKLEKLRVSFENEKVLLTDDQQKTRLAVIDSTEKTLNSFIEKKFGTKGESTSLRVNLIKPLQDQIWNAINAVAAKEKYNLVFDKSSDLIMVFTDSKYDITDKVLKQLGVAGSGKDREVKDNSQSSATTSKGTTSKTDNRTSSSKDTESDTDDQTTATKPKTGYGSKYVPKKKANKAEEKTDAATDSKKVSTQPVTTGSASNKVETKTEVKAESKATETKAAEKPKYGSKYVPKKNTKKAEEETEVKEEAAPQKTETKTTTTEKPKTGYGSKYVPKKKA